MIDFVILFFYIWRKCITILKIDKPMKTLRFFLCVTIIISAFIFCSCDRNDEPEQVQLGEVGVYCVLEQGWGANQQRVILKRVPLPGEPEIYTSVKGAQVRVYLVLKVSWKKSKSFASLYCRACQNDSVYRSFTEGCYSGCHSEIGFTRAGRANANSNRVLGNGPHIILLTHSFCFDWFSTICNANYIR